jgi:RHS repeat-associated protein
MTTAILSSPRITIPQPPRLTVRSLVVVTMGLVLAASSLVYARATTAPVPATPTYSHMTLAQSPAALRSAVAKSVANESHQLTPKYTSAGARFTAPGVNLRVGTPSIGRGTHFTPFSGTIANATMGAIYGSGGLTTSFTSTVSGVEQTFKIAARVAGGGPLTIKVPVHGLYAVTSGANVDLFGRHHIVRASYSTLKVVDARGHVVLATMHAAKNGRSVIITVRDGHATYPLRIDPYWAQTFEVTGAAGSGAQLGNAVAISPSGTTALVDSQGNSYHYVHAFVAVFDLVGGVWSLTTELTDPVYSGYQEYFGQGLAISGTTIAIGSPTEPVTGESGAVFIYSLIGGVWSYTSELTDPSPPNNLYDTFGAALALDGSTLVVSSANQTVSGVVGAGEDFVYVLSGGTWSLTGSLVPPSPVAYEDFGNSVAISGSHIITGAPNGQSATYAEGAVFVFTLSGGVWSDTAEIIPSDYSGNDNFGNSVAISGNTAVVGRSTYLGAAYVFTLSGSEWTQRAELSPPDGFDGDFFGSAVSLTSTTLLIGAEGGAYGNGHVYEYEQSAGAWHLVNEIASNDEQSSDWFGSALAYANGSVIVGAPYHHSSPAGYTDGAAYIYSIATVVGAPLESSELFGLGDTLVPANCPCNAGTAKLGTGSSGATNHLGEPIDTATGDFSESATDLLLPGPGPSLVFTRSYDAQAAQAEITNASPVPALGYGWTDNLAANVSLNASTQLATVTDSEGAQTTFSLYVSGTSPAWCTGVTNYCAIAPRVSATLNQNSGGTWTLVDDNGQPTTYSFAATGALSSIADAVGNTVSTLGYSPIGGQTVCPTSNSCQAWTSSASGRELVIATNGSGQITTVFDANSSQAATFIYTGSGCSTFSANPGLCDATDPGGIESTYTYDSSNATAAFDYDMLTFTPSKASAPTTNVYDTQGRVTEQTDPSGEITTFTYNGVNSSTDGGTTTITTYPNGLSGTQDVTLDTYASNILSSSISGYGTPAATSVAYVRDPVSLLPLSTFDGNGNATTDTYQTYSGTGGTQVSSANVLTQTDPLGNTTAYAYNVYNQPWCTVDPADYADGVRCPSSAPSSPPLPGASDPNLGTVIAYYNSSDQLVATTDAMGHTATFAYTQTGSGIPLGLLYCTVDPANYVDSVSCPAYGVAHVTGTATSTYDAAGDMTVSTDAAGNATSYAYGLTATQPGLPSSITDAAGDVTTLSYNGAGQVTSKVETFGSYVATAITAYDTFGRTYCTVSAYEHALGVTCPGSPPSPPSPSSDPYLGATITNYDAAGRVTQTTNPLGGVSLNAYDGAGELFCTVSPANAKAGTICPSSSSALTTPTPGSDLYLGATITMYDADNRAVQVTNPLGGIVLDALDANGNVLTSTVESNDAIHAPNVTTTYAYTGDNQISQITTATGTALTYYDPNGHVYCSVSPDAYALGPSTYQCPAWVSSWITAPPSPSTFYSTSPNSEQANSVTTTFNNAGGQIAQTTNPDVQTSLAAYDADGRVYCAIDPVNVVAGTVCPTTPPTAPPATGSNPGYATTIYNALGEVTSSTNQLGDTTAYTYDASGNVLTVTNPLGRVTTDCYYEQSCSGQSASGGPGSALYSSLTPATAADPSGELTTHSYYPGGLPDVTVTPAATTTLAYDALGDKTSETYSAVQSGYATPTNLTYTYNVDGSQHTMTDATGTTTYAYDANGDVTSQALSAIGALANQTISYTYFTTGVLSTEVYPSYPGQTSPTVAYAYNSTGQMVSSTDWLGHAVTYSNDASGNQLTQGNPNSTTTIAYDAAGYQTSASSVINQSCGGAENLLQSFGSTGTPSGSRNADGQLTQYGVSYSATCSGQTSIERNYSYDAAGQVVYQGSTVQAANPNTFAYDAASEPTTITSTVAGAPNSYTQAFNNSGEVTGQTHTSGTGGVSATYTYDSLGDQSSISSPATAYAYNADGQMVSATTPSGTTTYLYNGAGLVSSGKAPPPVLQWVLPTTIDSTRAVKSVSCPTSSFCAAVGSGGYVTTYNGTAWSTPVAADSTRSLVAISCFSSTFCVAVDSSGYETTFNGTSWSTPVDVDSSRALSAVVCTSATFCVAVGAGGYEATYTGTWATATKVDSTRSMTALSCASSTFCVAVDGSGYEASLSGSSWTASKIDGTKSLTSVSCPTSTFCEAVDSSGNAIKYSGSWATAASIDSTRAIAMVTCTSATFCVAVGASGYAATYNGTSWATATDVDGSRSLSAVSCASATFCVVVDGSGYQATYTGTWGTPSDIDAARALSSVACPSSSFCVAVDGSGYGVLYLLPSATLAQLTWDLTTGLPIIISDSAYDYVYGPGSTPVEQVNLATNAPTFLVYTSVSSTFAATNSAGDLIGFWGYDAYGNLSYGASVSAFGYAGQYTDVGSGLSNMRARFYQSQTGGFTTRDPAFAATDTSYGYAGGDGVNNTDPTGFCSNGVSTFAGPCPKGPYCPTRFGYTSGSCGSGTFVGAIVHFATSPFTALYRVGVNIYQNGANNCDGWRGFFTTKNIEDVGGFTMIWTADAFTVFGVSSAVSGAVSRGLAAAGGAFNAEDLSTVNDYLSSQGFLDDPANSAMVDRIQSAIDSGRPLTEGEQNFMTHELNEASLVNDGMSQEAAHEIASGMHPPFSNYDPSVISQFPELFNENWSHYWEGR